MEHRPPQNVKVINVEQAVRKGAKYPGEKHNQPKFQVGSEWQVLEHQIYNYDGVPINFYRVQFAGEEASCWLLDQSPSKDGKMLQIKYDT